MKKSILTDNMDVCYLCGASNNLELHHLFGGAYRSRSEHYGLVVRLCHGCHNEPPTGVHHNARMMWWLKAIAQTKAMQHYNWTTDEWLQKFGKNYL